MMLENRRYDPPIERLLMPTGFQVILYEIFDHDVVRLLLHIIAIFKHI